MPNKTDVDRVTYRFYPPPPPTHTHTYPRFVIGIVGSNIFKLPSWDIQISFDFNNTWYISSVAYCLRLSLLFRRLFNLVNRTPRL